jgi:hypothetical protein
MKKALRKEELRKEAAFWHAVRKAAKEVPAKSCLK